MYTPPKVIAKAIPFHYIEGQLLIALTSLPGSNPQIWELPSTYVYYPHTSIQALEQMLRLQCGLTSRDVRHREQLYTFEYPAAVSSEGNSICITYLYLSPELRWHKGARHIGLFPIDRLPDISPADHTITTYALERLKSKALYTTLPGFLLPTEFNLAAYQQVFETLTNGKVDRRNFRKKLQTLNILSPVDNAPTKKHGEATLYRMNDAELSILSRPFL